MGEQRKRNNGSRPLEEAGPRLDGRIERSLYGDRAQPVPARYSRDDEAADRLVRELEQRSLRCVVMRVAGTWYCVWWRAGHSDSRPERLATGSAPTRALSICRAVGNLPESLLHSELRGDPAPIRAIS